MDNDVNLWFWSFQTYTNWIFFCVNFLAVTLLLWSLKFKIDCPALFTLTVFVLASMIQVAINFVGQENYLFSDSINVGCQYLINLSLVYFILEMILIRIKLTSETYSEHQVKARRVLIIRRVACTFQIVTGLTQMTNIALLVDDSKKYINDYIGNIGCVLRYINYMVLTSIQITFLFLLSFFIQQRLNNLRAVMRSDFVKLTTFVKCVIAWSTFLCLITLYKSLTGFIEVTGHYIDNDGFYRSAYY